MNSKRHIVLTANTSWYVFNFRSNLIRDLLKDSRVTVFAEQDDYSSRLVDMGCDFRRVPFYRDGVKLRQETRAFLQLLLNYVRLRPDYVLNFTPKANTYSGISAGLIGAMTINNISGLGRAFSDPNLSSLRRVSAVLYRLSGSLASHTFYQNPKDLEFGLRSGFSRPEKSSLLPGSGVDLSRFRPAFRPQEKPFRFLYAARLMPEKGVLDFLRAAAIVQARGEPGSVEFVLAGSDAGLSPYHQVQFAELLAQVDAQYLGHVDNVEELLGASHCVVLPSVYAEGVPRSLIEASASGKLLICYPNPGSEEIVEHGVNGFVTESASVQQLSAQMWRALSLDAATYQLMCENGIQRARLLFDEKIVIEEYTTRIRGQKSPPS